MFLLGAGFMLVESRAVIHMALVFGSTWMVNSVVFFAVLVMILAANLYVLAVLPQRPLPAPDGLPGDQLSRITVGSIDKVWARHLPTIPGTPVLAAT